MENSFAQEKLTEMTVDRPGFAETPYTVLPKKWQIETGFDYFSRYDSRLFNLPTVLVRTGLSNSSELRVTIREAAEETKESSSFALAPVSLAIKKHVIKKKKWVPEMDVLAGIVLPVVSSPQFSSKTGTEFLLLFENDFSEKTAINYNIGFTWDSGRGEHVFTADFCYNYLPNDRLGLFVEYFGFGPQSLPSENGLDAGITYLLKSNLQADLSGGFSLVNARDNVFVSMGITVRL
ncbi:MAG: transporter [Cyclobacteriaceae bacterium]|nr:transporter [Cyclobacteriaceae bacterium]